MEFAHSETSKFYSVFMPGVEVKASSVYHTFFHLFIIIIIIIIIITIIIITIIIGYRW